MIPFITEYEIKGVGGDTIRVCSTITNRRGVIDTLKKNKIIVASTTPYNWHSEKVFCIRHMPISEPISFEDNQSIGLLGKIENINLITYRK